MFDPSKNSMIGTTAYGQPLLMSVASRRRHLYVVGQTGTGKSSLLHHLITQDLAIGRGVALIDPHGDLAQSVLSMIPPHRAHQLVYLNPADLDRPIGFNLLAEVQPAQRPFVAESVVAAFHHVWPDSWGPRLEWIMLNAVRTLMEVPGQTLLGLPKLLQDSSFRAACVAHVADPVVRQFWQLEYEGYDRGFRSEAIAPVLNKVGRVLATPALRNMVAQPIRSFDLRRMMDDGRILIVNLSKGVLGESTAALFGALLVTAIAQAALTRGSLKESDRRPFYLYADEFQSYATDSFALILSEARKYGLSLTLSHQYIGQLSDPLRKAVIGTAASIVAFRLGADDAELVARNLGFRNPSELTGLDNFQGIARLFDGHALDQPRAFNLFEPLDARYRHPERLIANSRICFGRDRKIIEQRIERFLLGTPQHLTQTRRTNRLPTS